MVSESQIFTFYAVRGRSQRLPLHLDVELMPCRLGMTSEERKCFDVKITASCGRRRHQCPRLRIGLWESLRRMEQLGMHRVTLQHMQDRVSTHLESNY